MCNRKEPDRENLVSQRTATFMFFIAVSVVIVGVCLISIIVNFSVASTEKAGQIGDSFGLATSIFTGLSLALIGYSLIIQRRDFLLSIKEFKAMSSLQTRQLEEALEKAKREAYPKVVVSLQTLIKDSEGTDRPSYRDDGRSVATKTVDFLILRLAVVSGSFSLRMPPTHMMVAGQGALWVRDATAREFLVPGENIDFTFEVSAKHREKDSIGFWLKILNCPQFPDLRAMNVVMCKDPSKSTATFK